MKVFRILKVIGGILTAKQIRTWCDLNAQVTFLHRQWLLQLYTSSALSAGWQETARTWHLKTKFAAFENSTTSNLLQNYYWQQFILYLNINESSPFIVLFRCFNKSCSCNIDADWFLFLSGQHYSLYYLWNNNSTFSVKNNKCGRPCVCLVIERSNTFVSLWLTRV